MKLWYWLLGLPLLGQPTITVTPAAITISTPGQTVQFTATPKPSAFQTWVVRSALGDPGTIGIKTGLYTAPNPITPGTVTIRLYDFSSMFVPIQGTATITLSPAPQPGTDCWQQILACIPAQCNIHPSDRVAFSCANLEGINYIIGPAGPTCRVIFIPIYLKQ